MKVFADALRENAHDEFTKWKERNALEGYVINHKSRNDTWLHRASPRYEDQRRRGPPSL
jgi:hypothetical protein